MLTAVIFLCFFERNKIFIMAVDMSHWYLNESERAN